MLDLQVIDMVVMEKTTWGVKDLVKKLDSLLISQGNTNERDLIIYGQALQNFQVHCHNSNITSIGRNQFTEWFHREVREQTVNYSIAFAEEAVPKADVPTRKVTVVPKSVEAQVAPVIDHGDRETISEVELLTEIIGELKQENTELKRQNGEFKGKLEVAKMQVEKLSVILDTLKALLKGADLKSINRP